MGAKKIRFTGDKIITAIKYHLEEEGWFAVIPEQLEAYLYNNISPDKTIYIETQNWEDMRLSGNHRIIFLMSAADLDPFILCRYSELRVNMSDEFNDIIDGWAEQVVD